MKLNAKQIIKALECCSKDDCDNCPNNFGDCCTNLAGHALSLIKELTEDKKRLRNRITCQVVLSDEQLEEIKNECLSRVELDIKAIQADTVRKMQERLSEQFHDRVAYTRSYVHDTIDQVAKEMLEENENETTHSN